jgi:hypothetical protein
MSKAEEYRRAADEAHKRAQQSKSLKESIRQRKRAEGLNQLADNEDWLDGKATPPKPTRGSVN